MQGIRSCYIYNIYTGVFDDLAPVYRPTGNAKLACPLFQGFRIDVGDDFQNRPAWLISKNQGDRFC
jgi:hypothetical protein